MIGHMAPDVVTNISFSINARLRIYELVKCEYGMFQNNQYHPLNAYRKTL